MPSDHLVQVPTKAGQYSPPAGPPVAIRHRDQPGHRRPTVDRPAPDGSLEQTEGEAEGEKRGLIDMMEAREADPFNNVDAAETRTLVRSCIDRLPDFLKQVVLMAYYQGLKYQEIADALDIPLGTVKSRLHAAVVKLHELWTNAVPSP